MPFFDRIAAAYDAITAPEQPLGLGLQASAATSTLANPSPWLAEAFGSVPTAAGQSVTPETAMRESAVYACERVLSESVAQLPLTLMRRTKDGGAEPADDHPLYSLLLSAFNEEMTSQDGVEQSMNHMLMRGTACAQIVRDQAGRIVELWPLHPSGVQMRRNDQGKLLYDYFPPQGGSKSTFEADEIWRNIGMSHNGIQGVSVITHAREAIGSSMAMAEHGSRLFVNGASIGTTLEAPNALTDEQIARLKEQMKKFEGSRNAHKTLVLEGGMTVGSGPLGMSNVDSQWIQARGFGIVEVCRFFRVPPHKVQELARATFNNIEHLSIDFVNSSLRPWMRRFELTGIRDLLLPNERKRLFLRFDDSSILQGDSQAQANVESLRIASRVINPNEARRKLGMNPYPGGDKYENPNTTTAAKKPGDAVPDTSKG